MGFAQTSLEEDRVYGVTAPDESGHRIYSTKWSVLVAGKNSGAWAIDVRTLPWIAAREDVGECVLTLQVSGVVQNGFDVDCDDPSLNPLLIGIVDNWGVQPIEQGDEPGALALRLWFERPTEDPTVMRGHVIPRKVRTQRPAGLQETPTGKDTVRARRKVPPVPSRDAMLSLTGDTITAILFTIGERGRPDQITIFDTPSVLWDSILRVAWKWRFILPDGAARGYYSVQLTFKPLTAAR